MASTKDVLDHHLKAFDQGDLNGVLSDYASDAEKLKPHHVIVAGLVSALAFVLLLFGLVQWITR